MRTAATLIAMSLALPASATTFGTYDNIYIFGDSLSDSGNVAIAAPQFVPDPPYPDGQFTNGDTWATQLGLSASLAGGTNFAFGGATAATNDDIIPDLAAQIAAFEATVDNVGAHSLGVIWIGGNDFLDLPDDVDPSPEDIENLVLSITGNIASGVQSLVASGISDIVVFGQPDFGILPEFIGDPLGAGGASFVSSLLNDAIEATAFGLNNVLSADVGFFDLDGFLRTALGFGPDEPITPQLSCLATLTDEECLDPSDEFVFFDDIHPVESLHTLLAAEFSEQFLTPVPLPAGGLLLLSGLAGLGLWSRRRKSLA